MELRLLGALEVWSRGRRISLGGPRAEKLLAALALEAGHAVPVERLVDVLWDDDPPATAARQVRNIAAGLRRLLADGTGRAEPADLLVADGPGYRLGLAGVRLDSQVFAERLALARDAGAARDTAKAVDEMRAALALCRGPTLAGIGSRLLASAAVELDERRLATLEECIELELGLGRHRELVGELAALVAEYPLRERFTAHLMLALYRNGRVSEALEAYRELRARLAAELGLDTGPELRRLESAILRADPALRVDPPARTWIGPRSHLTVLVGRDRERAEAGELLRRGRLVTLVGVGGVGKTSLVLAVAEDLAAEFADGVAVVALAGVRRADEVILAIGSVLRISGSSTEEVAEEIDRHLANRRLLLVLDNCEHVAAECAQAVRRLLAQAPGLAVLTSSRRPLGLAEEVVYGLDGLAERAAAELFARRAGQTRPGVVLDSGQVARICVRLDGLPLALELAAARLRALPLRELADRLDRDLSLLSVGRPGADPRHATLAAAIEWSYLLLEPDEQRLLARLSVFRAGFTAQEAEQICADPPLDRARVLPTLAALVDQSVVQPYPDEQAGRYRLLAAVREFAAGHLARLGETGAVADRHLDYRLAQFRRIDSAPTLQEVAMAGIAIWPEPGNLRAALEHGFTAGRPVDATELVGLSFLHWMVRRNHHTEGERWLDAAWPHVDRCPPRVRRRVRFTKAILHLDRGELLRTRALLRPFADDLDDVDLRVQGELLSMLTVSELRALNPAALDTGSAFLAWYRELDDPDQILLAVYSLGYAQLAWGRYEQAARLCEEFEALAAYAGPSYAGRYFVTRAHAEDGRGNHSLAAAFAARGREHFTSPGNYAHHLLLHRALVYGALCTGDARQAAADALSTLRAMYPPSMTRAAEFTVLLGEAHRRAGEHDAALPLLAEGLTGGVQDYLAMLPGVVSAALLAADLGDLDASLELRRAWEQVSRGLGLPVPQGFEAPAASVLGLDPAGGTPTVEWAEEPLRALVRRAATWCSSTARRWG